ncbi:RtcB family protein [Pilimelia columellifera]|uniref:3'-phosphate/5'-hydroxy nucleic acid ligase n=1 Tax=Pilimelia columellifera subsp. columellifera TaxID=706583 RepID=A0ABN3NLL3_9ACTN
MPFTLPGARVPVLMWTDPDTVEPAALQQLRNIAALPWAVGVRVMPDVHVGKGATVGSVIALRDAISPAAVGVDIGCGMSAVRTSLRAGDLPDDLRRMRGLIERAIPTGYHGHDKPVDTNKLRDPGGKPLVDERGWPDFWRRFEDVHAPVDGKLSRRAASQLGTLGGGNHFIEVCVQNGGDDPGRVWLMLHSGSRNIGKMLAEHHTHAAGKLAHNVGLPDRDLAVFLAGTPEMDAYADDLFWAQEYARRNRAVMMGLLKQAFGAAVGARVRYDDTISCHHNYVARERHDGQDVLVTRKGAIRAGDGDLGIIPGSMGTGSYIVRGRGNPDSYHSASHGAGRRMSRAAAKRRYTLADLESQTSRVECRKDVGVLDEIPSAYKDIDEVMRQQADLVDVVAHIEQVLCVKG